MKHGAMLIAASLAVVAHLATSATPALADGNRGQGHDGQASARPAPPPLPPSPFMRAYAPLPFNPRPFVPRRFVPSGGGGTVIVVPQPVPMGVPYGYDQGVGYGPDAGYDPSEMSGAPEGTLMPPPRPPMSPSVVEYPNGRYELRGDGMSAPYRWVWIPNPPPPPPTAPPSAPAVPPKPAATAHQSSESDALFSFVDDQGVRNWTDRWDSIPEKYRSQAKRLHF